MPQRLTNDEILKFVKEWAKNYESNSPKFFDNFSKDASIFALSVPTRIDSVEEYRTGFEQEFKQGKNRRTQVMSPEVRILGDTSALVTFHNRIHVDDTVTNNRVSLIVEKEKNELKICHLHVSPLTAPRVRPEVGSKEVISVLEERVATAIGAVGTPK